MSETESATPVPGSHAEIRGIVSRVRWHCEEGSGRVILDVAIEEGGTVRVLGQLQGDTSPPQWIQREVHVVGKWRIHESHGPQIQADGIVRAEPRTQKGVVKFLREVLGYSDSLARKLWTRFRERTPETLRTNPELAAATGLVTAEESRRAARTLSRLAQYQETFLSLASLFAGRRMPTGLATACIDRWGMRAPHVVRADPYLLMSLPGQVVGFARADALYLELGGNPGRLKRQLLFLIHAISTNRDGHTWLRAVELGIELAGELQKRGAANPRIVDAIKLGLRTNRLVRRRDTHGVLWITTQGGDRDERDVADGTIRLLSAFAPVGGLAHVA